MHFTKSHISVAYFALDVYTGWKGVDLEKKTVYTTV